MNEALAWWFSLEILGILAFPLAFVFFGGLHDRGYSLAKVMGLVLVGYIVWLAGILGLLANTRGSVILLLLLLGAIALFLGGSRREELRAYLRERWRYIAAVEVLFTLSFFVAAWLRSYVPEIAATEKPMEAALLSGLVRDPSVPPGDPWLSGHDMNYYYFGYLMTAALIKLTGIGVNIGFNLGLTTIVALGSTAAFGILYNLTAGRPGENKRQTRIWPQAWPLVAGVGAVVLLFIYSNQVAIFELMAAHGLDAPGLYSFLNIQGLDGPRETISWYPDGPANFWWWFHSSRVSPHTITEFPFFSFLLGDLHPHVLAIPFLLLIVGLGWNLLRSDDDEEVWRRPLSFLVLLILVGAIGFVHTINLPVVLAMLVIVYALRQYSRPSRAGRPPLVSTGIFALALTAGSLLVYLPFYVNYDTPSSGILATRGPDTRPFTLFLHWGLFLALVSGLAAFVISRHPAGWRFNTSQLAIALGLPLAVILGWGVFRPALESGPETSAGASGWLTLVWLAATLALLVLATMRSLPAPRRRAFDAAALLILAVAAVSVAVIMGAELFFIKDVFEQNEGRLNTVFKGWYLAWLWLGLAAAFSAYVLAREWRPRLALAKALRPLLLSALALLFLAGLVYPLTATMNRTNAFGNARTLDGYAFLKGNRPGEYQAIQWLTENVEGRPVIMEAFGDSFTEFARVSAYTGLPTVLGWAGHENQWRGSYAPQGTRREDVETAYNTTNMEQALAILDKYDVKLVYIGPLERGHYSQEGLEKFEQFMDVAFENGEITIYQRKGQPSLSYRP